MPQEIAGGTYVDARGALRFCNDFDMSAVKRFYTIANSAEQPVRGWIGHRRETKWFFPLRGVTTIEVEPMDDGRAERVERVEEGDVCSRAERVERVEEGDVCSRVERVERIDGEANNSTHATCSTRLKTYTLSADAPAVLRVSPGNWFCIKQDGNAEVMVFSNCKVGEFQNDDFRRPYE